MIRGADLVVRTLAQLGVRRIFTLSGNHIMPIFDALLSTGIEVIHVRHEAACVHMADAWGRLTGQPGIALVTGGQGHSNAVAALYTALASESPMILLSGHAPLGELGRGAFQEMPQADLARPVTKASWTAQSAPALDADIAKAMTLALSGRPGPVHVSLPVDLLEQEVVERPIEARIDIDPMAPERGVMDDVAAHLRSASKPLVICGASMCSERGYAMMERAGEAFGVPVIGMQSPRGINDPGLGAFAEILAQADLVVLAGKPLDFMLKFGEAPAFSPSCQWIVIDPDHAMIARASKAFGARLLMSRVAGAEAVVTGLIERSVTPGTPSSWHQHVRDALAYQPPQWAALRSGQSGRLHPVEMCRAVDAFLSKYRDATFISDGGEIGQWAQAIVKTPRRRLINGVAGTIGASLPFAIATQRAHPDQPVLALLGDGTFGFHMAEFDTAVRYGIPMIAVVGNDARWNAEYQIQLRQYGAERAKNCELLPSRYDLVVEALGGFGALVTTPADMDDALVRAQRSGKPACINVMIEGVGAPVIRR